MNIPVSPDAVRAARERISPWVHCTPVLTSSLLDELTGASLHFKAEHLQKVGAFKARGAVNAVFSLGEEAARAGVATHSSGNHGAALARAATLRGIPAWIVVPANARATKKAAIKAYGAEVIECAPTLADREATLKHLVAETGATYVPPYDSPEVVCGQGTAALELLEQVPGLEALVVPVGGGGLIAGCATVLGEHPNVSLYGAEPEQADDAKRSLDSGQRVTNHVPNTIADGLQTTLGALNFELLQGRVEDILLVSEQEITDAMLLLWSRLKQVVEPSSAVTLAAVLRYPEQFRGKRVGLILTGGNVDLADLPF